MITNDPRMLSAFRPNKAQCGHCATRRMIFWLDAQLPPSLAPWLAQAFGVEAYSLSYIGLHTAEDYEIFDRARSAGDVALIIKMV